MHGDINRTPGNTIQGLDSLGSQVVPCLIYYLYSSLRARWVLTKGQSAYSSQVCFTAEVPSSTQTQSHRLSTKKPLAPNSVASAAST